MIVIAQHQLQRMLARAEFNHGLCLSTAKMFVLVVSGYCIILIFQDQCR